MQTTVSLNPRYQTCTGNHTPPKVEVQDILIGEAFNNIYQTSWLAGYILQLVEPKPQTHKKIVATNTHNLIK